MRKFLSILATATLLVACNRDGEVYTPKGNYESGFLILNEGNFGHNNGSLTYTSYQFTNTQNNVYQSVNNEILGDTPQSAYRHGNDLYIVVNYSNKVVKVNRFTLKKEAETSVELSNPRYATVASGKVFVTNWGNGFNADDDFIAVLDPVTLKEETRIKTDFGVEKIFNFNNKVYALLQGAYGHNNKVAVINPITNTVEKYLTVGYNPNGFVVENDRVLISCGGMWDYSLWPDPQTVDGSLWALNTQGTEKLSDWADITPDHKEKISDITKVDHFYFFLIDGKLHKVAAGADFLTQSEKISDVNFYSIGQLSNLFVVGLDAKDYQSDGEAYFFRTNGSLEKTTTTGITPNSIVE